MADPARLTRMNRLATEARLVAGLAHELNNSLQVVGGLVELLATRTDLPSDAVARLEKVSGQTDKATSAIRRVVAYSRERPAEQSLVDLVHWWTRRWPCGSISLAGWGWLRWWIAGRTGTIACARDERQLTQAVLNLVLNAEEALGTASGSRQLADDADRDAGTRASRGQRQRERSRSRDPGSHLRAVFLDATSPSARSAWACPSAARSSKRTAGDCGSPTTRRARRLLWSLPACGIRRCQRQ